MKKKSGPGHRVDHKAHVSASLGGASLCGWREGRFWCPDLVRLPHVLPKGVPPDSCLQREAVKSVKTFLGDLGEDVVPPAEGVVGEMWPEEGSPGPLPASQPRASGFRLQESHSTPLGFSPMGFILITLLVSQENYEGLVQ